MNDTAYIAEFAENLWNGYIKPKLQEERQDSVSFYKAKVISNLGNGKLSVQRPYDSTITINCIDDLQSVSAGALVTVLVFGKDNAANHIAVSARGLKDISLNP